MTATLLAVHISDGILAPAWLGGGFLVAGLLALVGAWRIRDEEIPRVALLTAAFFVASLLHVPVGPTSVHLLFNGLAGVVLGRRVALAIPLGLVLQAALLGHGGLGSLGVNSCIMVVPALLAWQLFALLRRVPWLRRRWFRSSLVCLSALAWTLSLVYSVGLLVGGWESSFRVLDLAGAAALTLQPVTLAAAVALALLAAWGERRLENAPEFPVGLLIGEVAVLATVFLNCLALVWGGEEDLRAIAIVNLVAHLPIAVVEGVVLGFTVSLLARVKPDVIGWEGLREEAPARLAVPARESMTKVLGCLLALAFGLVAPTTARAHALLMECEVLPGHKVRVVAWYSARPKSFPAQEARVRVYSTGEHLLIAGKTDEKGTFIFSYERPEPLTVEVYQLGHRQVVSLFGSAAELTAAGPSSPDAPRTSVFVPAGKEELKDVVTGIGFLLALAAFVLSVRNARRLRALRQEARESPRDS
jgi:cobalt/nickel transport system permease protein